MDDKFLRVPPLKGVDDLLEVLTHQEKYIAQMQAMTALRDSIQERLGTLATKEEAERLLSVAAQKMEEAVGCSEVVEEQQEKLTIARGTLQVERAAFDAEKANWSGVLAEGKAQLVSERKALESAEAEWRAKVQQIEQALQAQQADLLTRRQRLEAEQEAWKARVEKLSALVA